MGLNIKTIFTLAREVESTEEKLRNLYWEANSEVENNKDNPDNLKRGYSLGYKQAVGYILDILGVEII